MFASSRIADMELKDIASMVNGSVDQVIVRESSSLDLGQQLVVKESKQVKKVTWSHG